MRKRILQFIADKIINALQTEQDEYVFNTLIHMGLLLDFYATEHDIWLE
ncbi:hypothetical protein UFOVP723_75 [uncultured Caudovirales phage]|uniref:Uncharacterized protein n=1 Tax=uncultured Caudovirales phage TaxID=2100421 RepID=A0A6J5NMR4_9CAUD|nr:hypothetical protein UFOVP723_75 [uncultured Caudovirales phage]